MEYDEKIVGGVPVLAIAQLALEATKVLFTPGAPTVNTALYEDPNIKQIAERKHINLEVAISIAAGKAASDTGNKTPSNDEILAAAKTLAEMSDAELGSIVDSTKGELAERGIKPDVPLTQQKSLIQNMAAQTGEFRHAQRQYHERALDAMAFGITMPWNLAKRALGYKSEEDQIAYDKEKWSSLGYNPEQVKKVLQLKAINPKITDAQIIQSMQRRPVRMMPRRTGRGEISGLQIAKLVLLVLVIIMIFTYVYTGNKMILGFAILTLFKLGVISLYDYLKTETPKQ